MSEDGFSALEKIAQELETSTKPGWGQQPKTITLFPPSNVTTLAGLEGWISTQLAKRGIPARRVGGILQANASSLQQFIETPAGKNVLLAMV